MIIVQGEVYLEQWHIAILKNEQESVRKRYHAIARTLVGDTVRITRQEAAGMIDRSRRQLQRIVKRYKRRRHTWSKIQIQKTIHYLKQNICRD